MRLVELRFYPLAPFTVYPDSYTLFGAFCWGYRYLFGADELNELIERFKKEPPFLLSSFLPVLKGEIYFPKPRLESGEVELTEESYRLRKRFKKLSFIRWELFKKVLNGEVKTEMELAQLLQPPDFTSFFVRENLLHATINRLLLSTTESAPLYNREAVFFRTPFSVLVLFYDESLIEAVEASFKFVRIGGDKSIGRGAFELKRFDRSELLDYFTNPTDRFFTLSPTLPDERIDAEKSLYDVKPYLGVVEQYYEPIGAPLWKKRMLYIDKGSQLVVKSVKNFYGGFVPAAGKKVYQYGYAMPVYARW